MRGVVLAVAALLMAVGPAPARAALDGMGEPIRPHGFPAYYEADGLRLEPCLPPPAGSAALRSDLCIFDPLQAGGLEVGSEIFWWMAEAEAPLLPGVAAGKAMLSMALEGAFLAEEPIDGQQLTFGRVRIRVDVPVPGTYRVTHPYGEITFEGVTVEDGINYTADLGAFSILDPAKGYLGALQSALGPFLTWPDYLDVEALKARDEDDAVVEQYVGDPAEPHVVTGSPFDTNFFRVEYLGPLDVALGTETDLFTVMGKVYDPGATREPHVFPEPPARTLYAVGPVNRAAEYGVGGGIPDIDLQPDGIVTGTEHEGYPLGYPLWYQERLEVPVTDPGTGEPVTDPETGEPLTSSEGGLKLTLCPYSDPMCIGDPVDPSNPAHVALRTGGEGFYWLGEAFLDEDTPGVPAGLEAQVVLGVESTFGGSEAVVDGNQIAFARLRIRVDVPAAGDYTITHPYGVEIFRNVPAGRRTINMTRDIMASDLAAPDGAFVGALFGDIGPRFLTWPGYEEEESLKVPRQVVRDGVPQRDESGEPLMKPVQYVGDPAVPHVVTGSPYGTNYFRVEGPNGIDVRTELFIVMGKVFDEDTFELVPDPDAPVAVADAVTLDLSEAASATVDVLANDTYEGNAQVAVLTGEIFGPEGGTATVNEDGTVTYTPDPGFSGADFFTYRLTDATGLSSGNATVTVTVVPVEVLALTLARVDLRRLRVDLRGTSTLDGATLAIYDGDPETGSVLGTAVVERGRWRFRGTATREVSAVSIVSSTGKAELRNQPVQVR